MIAAVVWAHFAILDEVKRGDGKVVPSRQVQVVQTLEGGIVLEILVEEGAIGEAGAGSDEDRRHQIRGRAR